MLHIALSLLVSLSPVTDGVLSKDQAIALGKETLSKHAGVAVEAISVEKADEVQWPDSSIGCPRKGMMYAQMITPGFKLALKAAGKSYPVHVGMGLAVVCTADANAKKQSAATSKKAEASRRGQERLAALLNVEIGKINVKQVQPKQASKQDCNNNVRTDAVTGPNAFRVQLEYGGRVYEYESDVDELRRCGK